MTFRPYAFLGLLLLCLLASCDLFSPSEKENPNPQIIDLRQPWQVTLVRADSLPDSIPPSPTFLSVIKLPGTLDDIGLGQRQTFDSSLSLVNLAHFTRDRAFIGRAWYQLAINIPNGWKGRRAVLTLERVLWRSQLWVNGEQIGEQNSLSTPHRYVIDNLDTLKRGLHVLTVLVDNRDQVPGLHARDLRYPPESQTLTHAYTEHAQVKWNGILGEISLQVVPDTGLSEVQVFADARQQTLRMAAMPHHLPGDQAWQVAIIDLSADTALTQQRLQPSAVDSTGQAYLTMSTPPTLLPWREGQPQRYGLRVWPDGQPELGDETTFGYRDLRLEGGRLLLNDQPTFLRGTSASGLFPKTGHLPTDRAAWASVMEQVQAYGFNLLQFPSWCPPEAAFHVADSLGLYLQVSLPATQDTVASDSAAMAFLQAEGQRIQRAYGNHPSFVLLSLGTATDLTEEMSVDGRHVIAGDSLRLPTVGGYAMYPLVEGLDQYQGVLHPTNLLAIQQDLMRRGLLNQARAMTQASGQWALALAEREMEAILTQPMAAGYVLTQLQDYAGQGGHWVGLIDAQRRSKGLIEPAAFARLNAGLVPLAQLDTRIYRNSDTLRANLQIANYTQPLDSLRLHWKVLNAKGLPIDYGEMALDSLPMGLVDSVGAIKVSLAGITEPSRLRVELSLGKDTKGHGWEVWVYPAESTPSPASEAVAFVDTRLAAEAALAAGKRVLWQVSAKEVPSVPCGFLPLQGSPLFADDNAPLLGLRMDSTHPSLAGFATQGHTDWQWESLLTGSYSMVLDSVGYAPLISVVDHFTRNRQLAVLAEAQVGPGRLLITTLDLSSNLAQRPAAQALRQSLLAYAASEAFAPQTKVSPSQPAETKPQ
jgi:hypothetical protein